MRYAYAITTALLLSGAASSLVFQFPASAQTAQNEPGTIAAAAPKAGAPMSFADMVAKLQPAVVNVSTKQKVQVSTQDNPLMQLFGGQDPNSGNGGGAPITREGQSLGSGFIISADGYVVTNAHVISAAASGAKVESITITLANRKEYVAKLIGTDTTSDLALLKVEATNLPFVKFGDSTKARVGDWVIAIGNPFGLGGTVTAGIISALHRVTGLGAYDRFIQTDAAINKGNSGGPMFDLNGNVIGINSQIYSPSEGSVGIGFAIPAEAAKPIIDTMMKGGKIQRGYLGVGRQPIDEDIAASLGIPKDKGELIGRVEPGQSADKAGIKQGDVIVAVNGDEVNADTGLSYLIANLAPGSTARLSVIRDGKPLTINAVVGTRPTDEELAKLVPGGGPDGGDGAPGAPELRASSDMLGIQVTALTPGIANSLGIQPGSVSGVVVTNIDPSSDAAAKSLQRGDIISSVNRVNVTTPAQMDAQVRAAKTAGRTTILLYITRPRQGSLYIAVKLKG
ncbi:Do family serine endopeptidase [Sphingomonas bacterium]|uniref:Do family serine endopeptidase n=1 Tax=Sphingomonas bacterium TaxID=1895847 RepID=UPI0026266662|nr:Do family serine endopeptidase [Sphingomonas bacterium]MDB5679656.1 protease [Sphingomonas bacterium]